MIIRVAATLDGTELVVDYHPRPEYWVLRGISIDNINEPMQEVHGKVINRPVVPDPADGFSRVPNNVMTPRTIAIMVADVLRKFIYTGRLVADGVEVVDHA